VHLAIDPHSGIPAFRQIVDQVRLLITSGTLHQDAELPSTRSLAQQLGINPMTVSKAYGLLEAEGLVQHRPGRSLTVCAMTAEHAARVGEQQVAALLEPAARAAVQLGVSTTRAMSLLREVMAETRHLPTATPPASGRGRRNG
jgi:GntR family transcriptional regulator